MPGFERYRIVEGGAEFRYAILVTNFGPKKRYIVSLTDGSKVAGIPYIAPKPVEPGSESLPQETHFHLMVEENERFLVPLTNLASLEVVSEQAPQATDGNRSVWKSVATVTTVAVAVVGAVVMVKKVYRPDPSSCVKGETKDCKTATNELGRQICDGIVWEPCVPFTNPVVTDAGTFLQTLTAVPAPTKRPQPPRRPSPKRNPPRDRHR